jgi:hypothetical protein
MIRFGKKRGSLPSDPLIAVRRQKMLQPVTHQLFEIVAGLAELGIATRQEFVMLAL